MMRFLASLGIGILGGYLLGLIIPPEVFMIACLALMGLAVLLFLLFHLGVRDFQDY